ncbi:MAG: hypothetical protein K1X94_03275 [Sandaracinaceae bacterium]|nr:hypothetical protein [Sandaracinaceae bacterium]
MTTAHAPIVPTFVPHGADPAERDAKPATSSATPPDLAAKIASLTAEQLVEIERHVDALRAGETPPSGPAPLEVLATRWWHRMDSSPTTRPLVVQSVRGLDTTLLQVPESGDPNLASLMGPGSLLYVLRASPNALAEWFRTGGPAARVGQVPGELAEAPLPTAPWVGYVPRVEGRAGRRRT